MWYPWHLVFCNATWGTVRGATMPSLWISWSVASVNGNLRFTNICTDWLGKNGVDKNTFPCLSKKEFHHEVLHQSLLALCFEYVGALSWILKRSRGCDLSSLNRPQRYRKWYPAALPLQENNLNKFKSFDLKKFLFPTMETMERWVIWWFFFNQSFQIEVNEIAGWIDLKCFPVFRH